MDSHSYSHQNALESFSQTPKLYMKPIRLLNLNEERQRMKSLTKKDDFNCQLENINNEISINTSRSFIRHHTSIGDTCTSRKLSSKEDRKREISLDSNKFLLDIATATKKALSSINVNKKTGQSTPKVIEEKPKTIQKTLYSTLKKLKAGDTKKTIKLDISAINAVRSPQASPKKHTISRPNSPEKHKTTLRNLSKNLLALKNPLEAEKNERSPTISKIRSSKFSASLREKEDLKNKRLTKDQEKGLINRLQKSSSFRKFLI